MKIRDKNPPLKKLIEDFNRKGHQKGVWKALAEGMNRPRRNQYEADVGRLDKFAKAKETIVVPGVVLAKGEISKPLNVAAIRFSGTARAKIEKAGGKCMDIAELDDKTVSKIRIMC
jgi:large subunit ribosomal protein L18e